MMKIFSVSFLMSFFLYTCNREWGVENSAYEAVTMSRTELERSIALVAPQPMEKSGKIYLHDSYLFLGDTNKGFHIYDNSDPQNPKAIAFLKVPGASDLAIRNDVMYINQAVDLVTISFDLQKKEVITHKRIANVFPALHSPDGYTHYSEDKNTIVIEWQPKKKQ